MNTELNPEPTKTAEFVTETRRVREMPIPDLIVSISHEFAPKHKNHRTVYISGAVAAFHGFSSNPYREPAYARAWGAGHDDWFLGHVKIERYL